MNFDGKNWRWSKILTPGAENIFNNLPVISAKKKNRIYANVYAEFAGSGSDADNDKLKYVWDFGDGRKSYLSKTRHKFTKTGKYKVTLKVSDGSEDVFEYFDIEVEKYPRRKIKIISLSPNPEGRDSELETLTVKNESKKKVNLNGWSVATGTKKLINHPITADLEIRPGKTMVISRKASRFTLGNKATKIELRYPDGEVADKVKYKKEKSVAEGEIYEKNGKKWRWTRVQNETENGQDNTAEINTEEENAEEAVDNNAVDEVPEDILGKYSENPDWQKKKTNRIILANSNSKIKLPENIALDSGRVLGASTVRSENDCYVFTPPVAAENHWVVKIFEYFSSLINSFLNNVLLRF